MIQTLLCSIEVLCGHYTAAHVYGHSSNIFDLILVPIVTGWFHQENVHTSLQEVKT